ncbi:acylneuraminate cytidylyltransferase family protein [Psychrobacillus sp. FSL K6-1415]|uniref:acylneuraminate cytidylyltransferase family protein n=1 Tax=Psychrobacillus sp. FSL K6-1415 TaxID=2921544 RepID=UPI0030FCC0E8
MKPKILAVIPARGGSKGLPRKNVLNLNGKPLIGWTIEAAQQSKYISKVILSSDDEEIIEVAKRMRCEVPFTRPASLAQDDSTSIDVVLHALEYLEGFDYVVLLQPTSPLRNVEDIDTCIKYVLEKNMDICVSVTESDKSPFWMYWIKDEKLTPILSQKQMILRRQELPISYVLNGAIYVAKVSKFLDVKTFFTEDTHSFVMPKERSLDIDDMNDFRLCEILLKK